MNYPFLKKQTNKQTKPKKILKATANKHWHKMAPPRLLSVYAHRKEQSDFFSVGHFKTLSPAAIKTLWILMASHCC